MFAVIFVRLLSVQRLLSYSFVYHRVDSSHALGGNVGNIGVLLVDVAGTIGGGNAFSTDLIGGGDVLLVSTAGTIGGGGMFLLGATGIVVGAVDLSCGALIDLISCGDLHAISCIIGNGDCLCDNPGELGADDG